MVLEWYALETKQEPGKELGQQGASGLPTANSGNWTLGGDEPRTGGEARPTAAAVLL